MSDILFDLELTTRRHVVETSGLKMQGQYLGQTQKVVENNLNQARGGLLFIDEAYTLGQGMFGSEACDTLVAAMTDPQYAGLVVVIAGYPKDIDNMLARNAGLKSRFTHTLEFPDWEVDDCVKFFLKKAKMNGFEVPGKGDKILQLGFRALQARDGFGNARDVDAVWKATCRFRADRIIIKGDERKQFAESDLQQATEELINGRNFAREKQPMTKNFALNQQQTPPCMDLEDSAYKHHNDAPIIMQAPDEMEEVCANEKNERTIQTGQDKSEEALQSDNGRDPNVSDEIWAELQIAKVTEEQ